MDNHGVYDLKKLEKRVEQLEKAIVAISQGATVYTAFSANGEVRISTDQMDFVTANTKTE